jgi:hypothetical protein
MYQYRQVLVRLRQGDSDRDIDRAGLMGRKKLTSSTPAVLGQVLNCKVGDAWDA